MVYGRFCHICGQENVEPKETFFHLVAHFIFDVTHFDGKFFSSVKYLLFRPGFLSVEYMKGRRVNYLNPIKMYVFTSAIFFLFFYSVIKPEQAIKVDNRTTYAEVVEKINDRKVTLQKTLHEPDKAALSQEYIADQVADLNKDLERLKRDTTRLEELNYYQLQGFDYSSEPIYNLAQYDSLQATLPAQKRAGWLEREYRKKKMSLADKSGNAKPFTKLLVEKFFHSFPQVMFVSLPLFALLLQLLYARRKNYYYADHIIYTIHVYCAVFILIFLTMTVQRADAVPYLGWLAYLTIPISVYIALYIYKSQRRFYKQSRGKTIVKYFLLLLSAAFMMSLLFTAFFILSVFTL